MSIGQKLMSWVDARFPATETYEYHMSKYYAPKNFNFWYFFGVLSMVVLVNQFVTGIWLTMMYNPSAEGAFDSVEYIMRDVEAGWLIRYMHSTGASAFFVVVYLHMFRGLLYGSYQKPRELVWLIGMGIYLVLMAEGFFGYLLPWGNMSFWGAQVILNLPAALPIIGDPLTTWVKGDYLISGITLNRFFALHVVALPLILVGLVFMHLVALHHVGSNNPDGVDIKKQKDENGEFILNKKGQKQADTALRDTEDIPLTENIDSYIQREVLPFNPDAWVDKKKTKVGFEIPFTRLFYKYQAPESSDVIASRIKEIEERIVKNFEALSGQDVEE